MKKKEFNLSNITFEPTYNSEDNDFIKEVYEPLYKNSMQYDRLVGFFKASVFSLNYSSIETFVKNGGKIRFITSHKIAIEEFDIALEAQKEATPLSVEEAIALKIKDIMKHDDENKSHLKVFSYFINKKIIDWKINIMKDSGMEHHKKGIFYDSFGNKVLIGGGVNETKSAITIQNDSMDVDCSWINGPHQKRISEQERIFQRYWDPTQKTKKAATFELSKNLRELLEDVTPSEDEFKSEMKKIKERNKQIEKLEQDQLKKKDEEDSEYNSEKEKKQFITSLKKSENKMLETLHPHQKKAIDTWERNEKKALLEYCTGSGKTYIAIFAIIKMLISGKLPIIIVPSTPLFKQWEKELRSLIDGVEIIKCSGSSKWDINLKRAFKNLGNNKNYKFVIIATIQTARRKRFKDIIRSGDEKFLIVDECHCLWAKECNTLIQDNIPWDNSPRLGLSATPDDMTFSEDIGEVDEDDENDIESELDEFNKKQSKKWGKNIFEFFGGKKENENWISNEKYELSDAIKDGILIPYNYHISYVTLTQEELDEYKELTKKLGSCPNKSKDNDFFASLIFARRALINGAENKLKKMIDILEPYRNSINQHHWLIYCPKGKFRNTSDKIIDVVQKKIKHSDFSSFHYKFTEDTKNREKMIGDYETTGGFLYAIDMMDEGVDITHLNHGMILSTSRNKRQFIQRRGRLLRKEKGNRVNKRKKAEIWDIIVLPEPIDTIPSRKVAKDFQRHVQQECDRISEFAKAALNSNENFLLVENLKNKYDFD